MSKTALQTSLRLLLDAWDNIVDIGQCKAVRNSSPLALIRVVAKNLVRCISEKISSVQLGRPAANWVYSIAFARMCTDWYHVIKLTTISGNVQRNQHSACALTAVFWRSFPISISLLGGWCLIYKSIMHHSDTTAIISTISIISSSNYSLSQIMKISTTLSIQKCNSLVEH